MIERIGDLPDHALGFSAIGEVTGEDYESVLIPAVEASLKTHEHLNLLYHLGPEFSGFSAGAMWNDAKVGLQHITAWKRIAVATDKDWIGNTAKAMGFLMPCHVRVFASSELDDARAWVSESS